MDTLIGVTKVIELSLAFGLGVILSAWYWARQFNKMVVKFNTIAQVHNALQLKYLEATAEMDAQRLEKLERLN